MINFDDFEYEEEDYRIPFKIGDNITPGDKMLTYWDVKKWVTISIKIGSNVRIKEISKMSKISIDGDSYLPDNYGGKDEYVVKMGKYWPWFLASSLKNNRV